MPQPSILPASARRGAAGLALFAALLALPHAASAQDPLLQLRRILMTRPSINPLDPADKQAQELKKFYDQREQEAQKVIDTRLRTFGQLRQALMLKEWGDVVKTQREDPELLGSDTRLRARVADRFRARVRAVVDHGDNDSKAAIANLITEMGLTVRAAIDPNKPAKFDELERERRSGFARSLTDEIIRLTQSDSEFVRLHALRALGGINADPRRATEVFTRVLATSNDVKARRIAADGLLRLASIVGYLKEQTLKSPPVFATDLDVMDAATEVVRHAPAGLGDADNLVRARCAEAMRTAGQVVALLFQRPPEESRNLTPFIAPYSPAVVAAVKDLLKAFETAGPRMAQSLADPEVDVRLALVQTLERLSDARYRLAEEPVVVGTINKVQDRIYLTPPRASDPLANFARGDWRAVAALLADPDVRVRRSAVNFLEFFPEARPAVVTDLTRALCDPDRFVRWGAARALGVYSKNYSPRDAVPAVPTLGKLLFDGDPTVRLAAAATLESLGNYAEAAVPEMARAAHYADADNRVAAMYALQAIDPARSTAAIPSITEALENNSPKVRRAAAETLANYGPLARNKATVDALRRALGDDDQDVRIDASEALLSILNGEPPAKK